MTSTSSFPRYWLDETSGVLRPAVLAYLRGESMSPDQIAAMRAYLRMWIDFPVWVGPKIGSLRDAIDDLTSREAISYWLQTANEEGIDPL